MSIKKVYEIVVYVASLALSVAKSIYDFISTIGRARVAASR